MSSQKASPELSHAAAPPSPDGHATRQPFRSPWKHLDSPFINVGNRHISPSFYCSNGIEYGRIPIKSLPGGVKLRGSPSSEPGGPGKGASGCERGAGFEE